MSGRCASSRQFITSQFQVHRWVPAASWSAKPFSSAANMALSFASRGRWRDIAGGRGCFSWVQAVLCSFLLASDAPLSTAPSPGRKSGARGSSASSQSRPSLVTSCHRPPPHPCGHRALRLCVAWTALSPVPLHFGGRFLPSPSLGNPRSSLAF